MKQNFKVKNQCLKKKKGNMLKSLITPTTPEKNQLRGKR